jgi:chromosome partitioning protein
VENSICRWDPFGIIGTRWTEPNNGSEEAALARIIAIANQKGGVGKTTTAINLAGSLAEQGYTVLAVDMDPQANLTVGMGLNPRTISRSMADALVDPDVTIQDVVMPTQTAGIDVAPSDIDLSATENQLFSSIGRESVLREALSAWADEQYDFIIIDCPPTLGLLTINSLVAADSVIIPVQTQYYALKGFTALNNVINQIRGKGLNPRLRILGLLPTFYDSRTLLARDMLEELRELGDHHVFQSMIKQTVRLGEAPLVGRPVTTYATNSEAARAYRGLAREVIELG